MSQPRITYTSETDREFVDGLTKCATLRELQFFLHDYRRLFPDAVKAAPTTQAEFNAFREGLLKERKGEFAGEEYAERYGAVMMPELAIQVAMIARDFGVPWGCAFIRYREAGLIKQRSNRDFYFDRAAAKGGAA